ncbi:uncharacterized protein [Anabrus simplex]|uniref:uncharacterized protein n=1 Tax=Anabrus simplex TaxID=316456 RepID=UPI0035A3D164
MAKWTNTGDITKDLDCLSEMTCGRRVTTTSPIFKPPMARGKRTDYDVKQPVIMDPFEDHRNGFEHCTYTAETIRGFGRGEVIDKMWKTLHKKNDCDLQWQLRAACGAGYSNDLIENAFRQESTSDQDSDQFEDAHKTDVTTESETESNSRSTSKSDFSTTNDPGSSEKTIPAATGPCAAADVPVSAENNNTAALEKSPSREPVKRKPRKYTNVLMDSLIRMKGADEESSILSTTKLNPDAQPFECHVSVNTSSVQTEVLNPDAQPFECHISVDSVTSNETNNQPSPIHQASNSTSPRNQKYSYPVRPTNRTYGYTDLLFYDNRPVHHANDFFGVGYDPVPIQDFQFRSEEFPPLS